MRVPDDDSRINKLLNPDTLNIEIYPNRIMLSDKNSPSFLFIPQFIDSVPLYRCLSWKLPQFLFSIMKGVVVVLLACLVPQMVCTDVPWITTGPAGCGGWDMRYFQDGDSWDYGCEVCTCKAGSKC